MTAQRVPGGVVHKLPGDLREALIGNSTALAAWQDITPLARNEFICWVEDAKQEKTRKVSGGRAAGPGASTASAPASSRRGRHYRIDNPVMAREITSR